MVLAHPKKLRVIAESTGKSDKLDAQVPAEFLVMDMIPQSHRPTPRQREHRVLVRHRFYVRRRQCGTRTKIRRILSNYNADRPDLFTAKGLAPGQRESAGRSKSLGITKEGSRLLRWALVEAAWRLVRFSKRWRTVFEGLARRRGKKKAIVAIARRLLCVMTAMLQSGRQYRHAAL